MSFFKSLVKNGFNDSGEERFLKAINLFSQSQYQALAILIQTPLLGKDNIPLRIEWCSMKSGFNW